MSAAYSPLTYRCYAPRDRVESDPPSWLVIHGFMGSAWDFAFLREHLSGPWAAATLPGHADAGMPPADWGLAELADAIAHAVTAGRASADGRPLQRLRVCGYSLGGRVALMLAARHPDLVQTLVLVSAHPGLESHADRAARYAQDMLLAEELDDLMPGDPGLLDFLQRWYDAPIWGGAPGLGGDAARDALIIGRALDACPAGWAAALRAYTVAKQPDLWPVLPRLPMPIHVIAGARDATYRAMADRILASVPGAHAWIVPDAGHAVHLAAPAALGRYLAAI